jgi:2-polyprenyl-3-methyl-5-hydroxy-6-metoxy-1,4-benzoquinol methylase
MLCCSTLRNELSLREEKYILPIDDKFAERANQAHWDEIAPIHLRSYGVDGLLSGISRIDAIQKREFYPILGKSIIHLQCHIGTDTLSLAIDGAKVTGVDFSAQSIAIARQLATKTGLSAEFLEANILDLKNMVSTKYDIVYTSKGVLGWISDIQRWAETVSSLLKDGGIFYIMEIHPAAYMFDDTKEGDLQIKYSYFHQSEPLHFDDDHPDYSDRSYIPKNKTYEWMWSLSDIMNALIRNGLRIELMNEHDRSFYPALPGMIETGDGWWTLKRYQGMIPLTFSLLARKAI